MRKKFKTLTASFLCMCLLLASGCGSSDDSEVGGLNKRDNGGGGGQATTQATTTDVWTEATSQATTQGQATTQATQAPATTEATTQQQVTTEAVTQATTQQQATTEATTQQTSSTTIQTKRIENEYYKVTVPDGWNMETWGAGAGFCFRCTNPQDPSMVIFYAGELYPIFTNEQQKVPYANLGEYGQLYLDAPVFADETVSSIYANWSNIVQFQMKYQGFSLFPVMTNIVDQGCQVTNDSMHTVNANFTDSLGYVYATSENGTSVISITRASIGGQAMDLFAVGYDNSPRSIVCMYFVECPQDKSDCVQTLMECVTSLEFTEKALQEQQQALNGGSGIGGTSLDDLLEQNVTNVENPNDDLPLPDGSVSMDGYDK